MVLQEVGVATLKWANYVRMVLCTNNRFSESVLSFCVREGPTPAPAKN